MSLYNCAQCGAIENTALGAYYEDKFVTKRPPRCSECATGKWHGKFPKVIRPVIPTADGGRSE